MESYKFRLQKLLDMRADKEEESKRLFKEAQLEREGAEQKLNSLKNDYNKYRTSESKNLVEQKLKHMYLNALNLSIVEADAALKQKNEKLEERREQLKQKQIERKTVETLKDKQFKAFAKEQELIEQKTNDEFALYGFLRARERR
ncbi:flagellar export protein FliJ [Clostridiales bacterium oral taxon 876 str. F0540]|nr:flagellar export protein FliJ [Clostridiales bacterium oral taxon 876 str. F0540]